MVKSGLISGSHIRPGMKIWPDFSTKNITLDFSFPILFDRNRLTFVAADVLLGLLNAFAAGCQLCTLLTELTALPSS